MPDLEWSAINTAVLLGVLGYLWAQARKVDAIYQALFGLDGKNGLRRRLEQLEESSATVDGRIADTRHMLRNETQAAVMGLEADIRQLDRDLRDIQK